MRSPVCGPMAKTTSAPPAILVLDVQSVWLRAVESILEGAGFSAVSTTSYEEALRLLRRGRFELLMLGADPDGHASAWAQMLTRVKKLAPTVKVIVVTTDEDPGLIQGALELGADAYVAKRVQPDDLVFAIRQVLAPAVYHVWPSSGAGRRGGGSSSAAPVGLTPREQEVLDLIAQGRSNAEIAKALRITEQTVKGHLWRLYRKLDVTNRTAAARWAEKVARKA